MNNLKKIGLSALAGSLAAVSANAAELGVSGGFQLNYSANGGTHDTTGNNWGMDNSVVLTASGDVNGYTVSYLNTLAGLNSGLSSSEYTVDLGDLGTIGFDQGVGSYGIDTIDNKMPNAYEEAEAGVGQDGISLSGSSGVFGYKNTLGPVALNVEYVPANGATDQDATNAFTAGTTGRNVNFAAAIDTGVEGLALGFGMMSEDNHEAGTQTNDAKEQTAYVSYTYESVTVGYQVSEAQDGGAGEAGLDAELMGIGYVADNFSISYGITEVEHDNTGATANQTEESKGLSAAYTMGGAALRIALNEADNSGGTSGLNDEWKEISLVLSF